MSRNIPPKRILGPADERAAERGFWFDEKAARRAVRFFADFLCHTKGRWAGKPFKLQPWQRKQVVEPLFGWKDPVGLRRFRKGYVEIPKKNGKSTLLAGIELYLLTADGEEGAEVYSAAVDRGQASLVFAEAAKMAAQSPALRKRLRVRPSTKRIIYQETGSFLAALSGDSGSNEGINASAVGLDELHAHKSRALYDTLVFSGAAREQPVFLSITTAGWDRESLCWEQHEYAKGVLSGEIDDDRFLALVYGFDADEKIDILDPEVHKKVNPSYGVTIDGDEIMQQAQEAVSSPRKLNTFKRYRLNIWTETEVRWLAPEAWDKCGVPADPVGWRTQALEALKGRRAFTGLDLGATSDLTALVLLFPEGLESRPEHPVLIPFFWAPREGSWRRHATQRAMYETWEREGFLDYTAGNVTDYSVVRKKIGSLREQFNIVELAIDRVMLGYEMSTSLQEDGLEVIAFGQGFLSMAAPAKRFEERVLAGEFTHGGNPVLSWMARNCTTKEDPAGNIKPVKPSKMSGRKIDGIVAALMALGRWMEAGEERVEEYVWYL